MTVKDEKEIIVHSGAKSKKKFLKSPYPFDFFCLPNQSCSSSVTESVLQLLCLELSQLNRLTEQCIFYINNTNNNILRILFQQGRERVAQSSLDTQPPDHT